MLEVGTKKAFGTEARRGERTATLSANICGTICITVILIHSRSVCVCVYVHVYILNEPKYGGKNWNVSDTVQLSGSWRTSLGQNVILDFIVQHCCL